MAGTCGTGGWTGPLPGDPDNNSILSAVAIYGGIDVSWTYPQLNPEAVSYVELYRGNTSVFATAPLYRVVAGNSYFDAHADNDPITYFYWIRIISQYGTQGDPIGPASATTGGLANQLITALTGQLDDSLFVTSLRSKIDSVLTVQNDLISEINARLLANTSLTDAMALLNTANNDFGTMLLDEITQRADADLAQVTSIDAIASRLSGTGDVGSAIVVAQQSATSAQNDADTALFTAQGKNKVFYALVANPPTALAINDLWVQVDNSNILFRWDGFDWINIADTRIVSTAEDILLLQAEIDDPVTGLNNKASIGYVDTAKADAVTASAIASQALVASIGGQNFYTSTNPLSVPDGTVGILAQELKSSIVGDPYQLLPDEQLTLSGRIWQDAASLADGQRVELLLWTADATDVWKVVGALTSLATAADAKTATITLPVTTDMVKVAITLQHAGGAANTTGVVYADHIQVERGSVATPYKVGVPADGSTDLTPVYAAIQTEQTARTDADSALTTSIDTLQTTVGGHTTTLQTTSETIDGIQGKYAVKIDANGYVAGFGLVSESNQAGVGTSEFSIVADKFSIAPVTTDPAAVDGSPFFHLTTATTINGVLVPAGTYMKSVYIHEASIDSAQIADAAITNAKIAGLIYSNDYVAGLSGWSINKSGQMEMNNAVFRGEVAGGQTAYNTGNGWWLGKDPIDGIYKFSIGIGGGQPSMTWDGTLLRIKGLLDSSTIYGGLIEGATIVAGVNLRVTSAASGLYYCIYTSTQYATTTFTSSTYDPYGGYPNGQVLTSAFLNIYAFDAGPSGVDNPSHFEASQVRLTIFAQVRWNAAQDYLTDAQVLIVDSTGATVYQPVSIHATTPGPVTINGLTLKNLSTSVFTLTGTTPYFTFSGNPNKLKVIVKLFGSGTGSIISGAVLNVSTYNHLLT